MIVKFLEKAKAFDGVGYNTEKMATARGELMKTENFGALEGIDNLRPQDYINYLEALTAGSSRIKYPQLHVVISCKGRSHTKEQLTEIGEAWLKGMGYGEQPYMLVFHNDTKNNHIHAVSTRIGRDGKRINHDFERIRAYQVLNKIMEQDVDLKAEKDIAAALTYHFGTRAQFMMILESQGYGLRLEGDHYSVFKFGTVLGSVPLAAVDERIKAYSLDIKRLSQLRGIFYKYQASHDPALFRMTRVLPGGTAGEVPGWNSAMAEHFAEKLGVKVLFHSKDDKPAYAYSIIDHVKKIVCKGGELMPLAEFTKPNELSETLTNDLPYATELVGPIILHQQTRPQTSKPETIKPVPEADMFYPDAYPDDFFETGSHEEYEYGSAMDRFSIDIADDVDDEAILGMKRHRKRKARTNTR